MIAFALGLIIGLLINPVVRATEKTLEKAPFIHPKAQIVDTVDPLDNIQL